MTTTTIFTAHRPVAAYLRLPHPSPPDVLLRGLDSFLLRQSAGFYPVPPTFIDLAADATGGASALLALAHRDLFHAVYVPIQGGAPAPWRSTFAGALSLLGYTDAAPDLDTPLDLDADLNPLSPPLFLLAPGETPTADVIAQVTPLLEAHPQAALYLLGGAHRLAVAAELAAAGYIVTDTREVHPLFKASTLTVAAHDTTAADVLQRIGFLFDGNLNHTSLPASIQSLADKLGEMKPDTKSGQ
jgi:hypothetical protein